MTGRLFVQGYNAHDINIGRAGADEQEFDLILDYYPPARRRLSYL
jgi:hypothetical protein